MKTNESTADRIVRIVVGLIMAGLAISGVVAGTLAVVAWVVAAIALVTGAIGFCPLYAILRFSTKSASR